MNSSSMVRWSALLPALALVACASQRPAPVIDRSGRSPAITTTPTAPPTVSRVAKDGIYVAQRGDTLQNVALAFGVGAKDLARWNGVAESDVLIPGQTLQVTPPASVATVSPITGSGQAEVRPLPPPGASAPAPAVEAPAPLPPVVVPPPASSPAPAPPTTSVPPVAALPEPSRAPASLPWIWPTPGKVIETFDDPRNKGIDIAGNEGAPVQAAADGEVVYVGSAVRGYGNLVIVRHSDDFITAYAHNRKVLVAEKQSVKRGQPIAELGRSDADRPKLHFEIRHQGKPVDPLKYLPARSQ
ncbi:MAG TPA: peptidoglycan DD-metalloendopeptidase family protein [Burkholderiaceae bacterium]|nr:peptidoglycan DD-metalloendopeptidase family protein [Burkholderiaceae bacterium]